MINAHQFIPWWDTRQIWYRWPKASLRCCPQLSLTLVVCLFVYGPLVYIPTHNIHTRGCTSLEVRYYIAFHSPRMSAAILLTIDTSFSDLRWPQKKVHQRYFPFPPWVFVWPDFDWVEVLQIELISLEMPLVCIEIGFEIFMCRSALRSVVWHLFN